MTSHSSKQHRGRPCGFTLIEVLMSIALIAVVAAFSWPVYSRFQTRSDLFAATSELTQSLRRAQVLAQAPLQDSSWGVAVQGGSITLYKGVSFGARDASYDEEYSLPSVVTPSGASDVAFDRFTGDPLSTGTFTLTSLNGEVRTVTVNSLGMVQN